ncbi:type III-B CRISPR module RAMP protein Cmr1 [Clostridium botulinum]|uniref:CRISPR-associated RAMP protein, Cmr1 family n=1 Tax=Clostridium botulinum (strain Langeland / NCTC 10281 / Type F) TaxID=441772 RepID=A7GFB1_CLOBL|nr:type III-B CRISPR module RAMP protein Cmr1 [Clostridium botulinum]ABS42399.1 CRISPR-associated RAMP protein, Cmr1 family [Clostridium botulinum F str. Langeland]ADF99874.1 CRISPR-associated RAMP protein, Cmr1 family [Clostridium botulinum F str. 230613]KKM42553.1 CRISPR-associated protein Cmr1 [Clostridium botulinum]MBY6792962.1 type III-B CRISPR module RAMP protein Cmr1 [Clostridium botulinum]MBY6937171.1 type III-B CRISPR module RAMP protein Cmr1 [Clostridium botulinum]
MERVKVTLGVVTDMFSEGVNSNKEAEFRITELKALLRSTFREFFYYTSLDDLKEKEELLFGSTNRKSPVIIKFGRNNKIRFKDKKKLVLHKNMFKEAIPSGTTINIIFQSRYEKYLKTYVYTLKLASIMGALGKRSRKGMGAFKIIKIDDNEIIDINKSVEDLLCGYEEQFKINEKIYLIKTRKLLKEKQYKDNCTKYKIECDANMPKNVNYVKNIYKIYLGNLTEEKSRNKIDCTLRNFSWLNHYRLSDLNKIFSNETIKKIEKETGKRIDNEISLENLFNKEILGNYNYKYKEKEVTKKNILTRFACPVYVTIYQKSRGELIENYLIIKELNYDYVYKKILDKKVSNKKVTEQKKEEIRTDIKSELKEMKPIDKYYVEEFVKKIIECCEVK